MTGIDVDTESEEKPENSVIQEIEINTCFQQKMRPHEKIKRQKICNGVAKYIAKRLKTDVVLECFAGNGFLTAQLAKESNFVLAVDTCKNIINNNKAN